MTVFRSFDVHAVRATVNTLFPSGDLASGNDLDSYVVALSDRDGAPLNNPDGSRATATLAAPWSLEMRIARERVLRDLLEGAIQSDAIGAHVSFDQFIRLGTAIRLAKWEACVLSIDCWRRDGNGFVRRELTRQMLSALFTQEGAHLPAFLQRAERQLIAARVSKPASTSTGCHNV